MPYFLILVLLGIAPAVIAYGKGRNFALWWIYGAFLAPVAFIHALVLPTRDSVSASDADTGYGRGDPDSPLPMALKCAGIAAIALTGYVGYRVMVSPEAGTAAQPEAVATLLPAMPSETPQNSGPQQETDDEKETVDKDFNGAHPHGAVKPQQSAQLLAEKEEKSEKASNAGQTLTSKTNSNETIRSAETASSQTGNGEEADSHANPASANVASVSENRASSKESENPAAADKPSVPNSDVTAVGEIVSTVQAALAERGYDPGAPNGRADAQTRDAIRKFQVDRQLPPTGAIDYSVLKALGLVGPRVYAFKRPPDIPAGR